MGSEQAEFPTRITIEEDDSESPTNAFISRNRCCFNFPCFPSHSRLKLGPTASSSSPATATTSFWDRIRVAETEDKWWARPIRAFKKLREWSEIVAGPKWKTFIRRFNNRHHNRRHHHHSAAAAGKFQYDPLSYALNFDEGPGQNGQLDDDYGAHFPDFSTRLAGVPLSSRSSLDLGKGGAPAG